MSTTAPIREYPTELIAGFLADDANRETGFKEDWTRTDFIEPLLHALGWERINHSDRTTDSTGYMREQSIDAHGLSTVPDYSMYVSGQREFYIEAKKPSVNIEADTEPAIQIREYGWNSGDPIGVLTDFEEFAVYNCRVEPKRCDAATDGRVKYFHCSKYQQHWDWLVEHFTPEAVADGALERLANEFRPRSVMKQVDETLLADIERWRVMIANDLHSQNSALSVQNLNYAVQLVIDRILFLRIAEARGLPVDGSLADLRDASEIYKSLVSLFQKADTRYNSGLFHFSKEKGRPTPDTLTPSLTLTDAALRPMIHDLTDPLSSYRFDVMPADILGQMYEQMLGKVLVIDDFGCVNLILKPEVRKAGGVFYTPDFIVRHIVRATLDPLLEGKTPNQVSKLRIVDPSCGSGSFLIGAYQYLLDWHLAYYSKLKKTNRKAVRRVNGVLLLTSDERKRILINNIFGVDIDGQAVEVAKLSLLLKVVEGETQLSLAVQRLLPDLHNNIQCGNSLIGPDFHGAKELINLTADERSSVNAFDWADAFPKVADTKGFDAVIGNPPWLMAGYYLADAKPYLQRHYTTWTGKADLYYLFLEKACRIVHANGRVGMIVPSKLFHTKAAAQTRDILSSGDWIESIVDFGIAKIFSRATNYSTILQLKRQSAGDIQVVKAGNHFAQPRTGTIERNRLGRDPWHLIPKNRQALWDRVLPQHTPLSDLTERFGTGVQTGRDPLLIFDIDDPRLPDFGEQYFRPTLKGAGVRRFSTTPRKMMFFPYQQVDDKFEILSLSDLSPSLVSYLTTKTTKKSLESRRWFHQGPIECSGRWYGLMFVDHPWVFQRTHLVTPGISNRSNFALGDGSVFVTGTAGVNSVVPREEIPESPLYLLALLNSSLLSNLIVDHSTPYQGGYFKFSTPYIKNAPIRRIDFALASDVTAHEDLGSLASGITERKQKMSTQTGLDLSASEKAIRASEKRIDEIVFELYGLSDAEIVLLRESEEWS